MKDQKFQILSNIEIADQVYQLDLSGDTSQITKPGQFVNVKIEGFYLRRPISICDYKEGKITLIYKVVGEGTKALSQIKTGTLDVLCPLGNGYDLDIIPEDPILVGGGVGVPPMYGLAKALCQMGKKPEVVLGFGTKKDVFYHDQFKQLDIKVNVATEDGSYGHKGLVTDLIDENRYICGCGPEPMLKAIDGKARDGQYSFEARMACGFGGCMGCSCQTKYGSLRICTDGPVLKKEVVIW